MNAPCPVMDDLGRHLQAIDKAESSQAHRESLEHAYTHDGIDWDDVAGRTEENVSSTSDVLALVYAMPDCPARRVVVKMLKGAAEDYAECQMQRMAA